MAAELIPVEPLPYPGENAACAGGKPADTCNVLPDLEKGVELYDRGQHLSDIQAVSETGENLTYPSTQAYFPLGCVACKKICEVVYEKINGRRTETPPAVFWLEPDTYSRVRENALKNIARTLLASTDTDKKDKVVHTPDIDPVHISAA